MHGMTTSEKRTAFVTGATGFVGQHLVRALLRRGFQVTVLARRPEAARTLGNVEIVAGDLSDTSLLTRAMPPNLDAVFHVAANLDFTARDKLFTDNVLGTERLVEAALVRRAKRFVFTSTSGVWGLDHGGFDETRARRGSATGIAYLQSKQQAEERVQDAVRRGLDAVILNPGHVVGRSQRGGWDQMFAQLAAGTLRALPPGAASWCDVVALADVHVAAYERGRTGHNYLIGGADASYVEFAGVAARALQVRAPRSAPPIMIRTAATLEGWRAVWTRRRPALPVDLAKILCGRLVFSSRKAVSELGYQPVELESLVRGALPAHDGR
jgi:dihydroflavonol-4-reductase